MIFFCLNFILTQSRPDGRLVQPLPRDEMTSLATKSPCGGIPKGKSHLLSEPGSLNPISWEILSPAAGFCSIKLSFRNDFTDQHILIPTDDSTDTSGFFPCGSEVGLFSKVFKFPEALSCDSCTLQWVWENNFGTYFECSDIEVQASKDGACYGKCQNEGFCSEGLCVCKEGFVGTFCEENGIWEPTNIVVLFLSLMVLLSIAACLFVSLYWRMNLSNPSYTEKRCFEMCCSWLPLGWKNWHEKPRGK